MDTSTNNIEILIQTYKQEMPKAITPNPTETTNNTIKPLFANTVNALAQRILSEAELRHGMPHELQGMERVKATYLAYALKHHGTSVLNIPISDDATMRVDGPLDQALASAAAKYVDAMQAIVERISASDGKTFDAVEEELTRDFQKRTAEYLAALSNWKPPYTALSVMLGKKQTTAMVNERVTQMNRCLMMFISEEEVNAFFASLEGSVTQHEQARA
jgi:hypothetical protein